MEVKKTRAERLRRCHTTSDQVIQFVSEPYKSENHRSWQTIQILRSDGLHQPLRTKPRYIRGTTQTRLGQTTQQRGGRGRPTRTAGPPGVAGLPGAQPSQAGGTDWTPSREVWCVSPGKVAASRSGSGPSSGRAFLADRKSTRLNSSHSGESRMPSSA